MQRVAPVRGRGLKFFKVSYLGSLFLVAPVRGRGLKYNAIFFPGKLVKSPP